MTKGAIYTVSWKGSGTGSLAVYFSNGAASSARQYVKNGIPVTANSNYQGITFYSEHFKLDPSLETDNGINLTVKEVKVEEGERATDWCYSDGDYSTTEQIKTGITVKENAISIFGKDVSLQGKITFSSLNSSLQSTINNKADSGDVTSDINSSKEDMAKKLGYASYADMVSAATAGNTIIEGGHIRTSLIEADALVVKTLNATDENGINTLVDKSGLTMSRQGTELLKISSWKANQYLPKITMVYDSDKNIEISPVLLKMRSSSNGIDISPNGVQVILSDGVTVFRRPRILWAGYILSTGTISYKFGNYITVSVSKTATGVYKVTHNIGSSSYYVMITPLKSGWLSCATLESKLGSYFTYATNTFNAKGEWLKSDTSCMVMIVYNPSLIYDA